MGNCVKPQHEMVWAGEDWESVTAPSQKESLLRFYDHDHHDTTAAEEAATAAAASMEGEIKIKITKKQLEGLLKKAGNRMTAEQVLLRLINVSEHCEVHSQRSWRPRLQSIPEVGSFKTRST